MAQTFYLRETVFSNGTHTADKELTIALSSGASSADTITVASPSNKFGFLWTGSSDVPNNASWPTGDYRCQINMTAVPSSTTFGFRTVNAVTGHFAMWDTGSGDKSTWAQTEGVFSGTGNHLATTGSITPSGEDSNDRFEALLAVDRPSGQHGSASMTHTHDSSTWIDGPWAAAASTFPQQTLSQLGVGI